jgi:hypothetical protein
MTSRAQLETLLMRMQDDYLSTPFLRLTVDEAERRFAENSDTCRAILETLVDAKVLARTGDAYVRYDPRAA